MAPSTTERIATVVLGLYSGVASVLIGWLVGLALITVATNPSSWLPALAISAVGLVIVISPGHLLGQIVDTLADFRERLIVAVEKRYFAFWGGLVSTMCGVFMLALTVVD